MNGPLSFRPPVPFSANFHSAIEHVKKAPKPKTPRAVSPEAACVSDHSCGQAMPPQRLPVQPQKNPPIPPNPSCCRSRGGMRGWPLPRPTHAPATTLKTNGNSAPIKPMSFPSSAWECVPRSSASHSSSLSQPPSIQPQQRPPQNRKNKTRINPRRVSPAARRRRMSAPERVKQSLNPPLTPRAAAPEHVKKSPKPKTPSPAPPQGGVPSLCGGMRV